SGGVDSLTAGLLAQHAMRELRTRTGDDSYKFIAVRLPYETQFDEHDAKASVDFIAPDERHTVNIGPAVKALASEVAAFEGKQAVSVDFVLGNT
ncbi:NAD(+) synthase, partial [Pseudomonas syringae]